MIVQDIYRVGIFKKKLVCATLIFPELQTRAQRKLRIFLDLLEYALLYYDQPHFSVVKNDYQSNGAMSIHDIYCILKIEDILSIIFLEINHL